MKEAKRSGENGCLNTEYRSAEPAPVRRSSRGSRAVCKQFSPVERAEEQAGLSLARKREGCTDDDDDNDEDDVPEHDGGDVNGKSGENRRKR